MHRRALGTNTPTGRGVGSRGTGKKKALLVGINKYSGSSELHGCVNDSYTIKALLVQKFGFAAEDIKLLLDEEATQREIIAQMKSLARDAGKDDILVFAYSGHGSQVDDPHPLADNYKEDIICPIDLKWDDPLTGHVIRDCLKPASDSGAAVILLMDCCHSGHIDRNINPNDQVKSRYLPPPSGLATRDECHSLRYKLASADEKTDPKSRDIDQPPNIFILLSGCQDVQTSADANFNGVYHGAFTYFLEQSLRENSYAISYENLHQDISRRLQTGGFLQRPNFLAPDDWKSKNFLNGIATRDLRPRLEQREFENMANKIKQGEFSRRTLLNYPRAKGVNVRVKSGPLYMSKVKQLQELLEDFHNNIVDVKNDRDLQATKDSLDELFSKFQENLDDLTSSVVKLGATATPDERVGYLSDLSEYADLTDGIAKDLGSVLTGLATGAATLGLNAVAPGLGNVAAPAVSALGTFLTGFF